LGRLLAIDFGQKRTGIAVTDTLQIIAQGLTTIPSSEVINFIQDYLKKEKVDKFIVGYPKQMNNQPSEALRYVNPFIKKLDKTFNDIPIVQFDERFTSKMAQQAMIDGGLGKKARQNKAMVDQISATIILQSYMQYDQNFKQR
jgi:putative Holliday junction resolvase